MMREDAVYSYSARYQVINEIISAMVTTINHEDSKMRLLDEI